MRFEPTILEGAWRLLMDRREDERGHFARLWCAAEFGQQRLATTLQQCSLSYNRQAGTIRGMHYQAPPGQEVKIVRCVRGAIHDVLLDLRPASITYKRWVAQTLKSDDEVALYVPVGVAHGFQTLTDDVEVLYLIDQQHDASLARGVRWNDPAFAIEWPLPPSVMSAGDRSYPDFDR